MCGTDKPPANCSTVIIGDRLFPDVTWALDATGTGFYLTLSHIISALYFTISAVGKLGLLFTFWRASRGRTFLRHQSIITCQLVMVWCAGCTIATLNCISLKWNWSWSRAEPEYCFDYNRFWMTSVPCEMLLDVIILIIPIMDLTRYVSITQSEGYFFRRAVLLFGGCRTAYI